VVAVGIALLAGSGWWVLRAPLIDRPVAHAREIDLDTPAMRARRKAAVALATMPDDPWTFAESLGASTPASSPIASGGRSLCGSDERPEFGDMQIRDGAPVLDQLQPGGTHYTAARARLDATLRASPDAFDRAVADWLDVGQMRTPTGRVDALVQQANASSDPRVYMLAFRACRVAASAPASCATLSSHRWAELDPGNGVPWIYALEQARAANDAVGQEEALTSLASTTRFNDGRFLAPAAVAARVPDNDADLAATGDLATEAMLKTFGDITPVAVLLDACKGNAGGDAGRARQCQGISDTMFDHTDSVLLRAMAGALQARTTGDNTKRDLARAERDQAAKAWSPATGFSECAALRDTLKSMRRKGEIGEPEETRERVRAVVRP
jgi:hypothetical protein